MAAVSTVQFLFIPFFCILLMLVHTRNSFFCEVKSDLGTTNWCGEHGTILSSIQEMGSAKYEVENSQGKMISGYGN